MQTAAPIRRRLTALVLLICLLLTVLLPRASAASLQNLYGIQVLSFDSGQILSIGNQAPGQQGKFVAHLFSHHQQEYK